MVTALLETCVDESGMSREFRGYLEILGGTQLDVWAHESESLCTNQAEF